MVVSLIVAFFAVFGFYSAMQCLKELAEKWLSKPSAERAAGQTAGLTADKNQEKQDEKDEETANPCHTRSEKEEEKP